jgi:hypothetical protein
VRRTFLWDMVAGVVDTVEDVKEMVDMMVYDTVTEVEATKDTTEEAETGPDSLAATTPTNMSDRKSTNVRGPILLPGSVRDGWRSRSMQWR